MFDFKFSSGGMTGKVFKKLNHMDKKQAYTYAAIGIVALVALLTLASVAGSKPDDSFDDLSSRGYDLAQMPFLNDEAENFLLASKYPDMKNNGVSALYTPAEKEERQEEDAAKAAEAAGDSSSAYDAPVSSGGGYTGRGGGAPRTPTQIGSFTASGSMATASGGNTSSTYGGNVKGDFSAFQRQDKGREAPYVNPQNARQALSRFNAASRAAARGANKARDSQKALFGSKVDGSFGGTDANGVPLGDGKGIAYEDAESADLSGLDETMAEKAQEAKEKQEKEQELKEESFWSMLGGKLLDMGLNLAQQWASNQLNMLSDAQQAKSKAWDSVSGQMNNPNLSAEEFQKTFNASKSDFDKFNGGYKNSGFTNRKDWRSFKNKFKQTVRGSDTYLEALNSSSGSGSLFGRALGNTPMPGTSGNNVTKSYTEYQNCLASKGKNCARYKPN